MAITSVWWRRVQQWLSRRSGHALGVDERATQCESVSVVKTTCSCAGVGVASLRCGDFVWVPARWRYNVMTTLPTFLLAHIVDRRGAQHRSGSVCGFEEMAEDSRKKMILFESLI